MASAKVEIEESCSFGDKRPRVQAVRRSRKYDGRQDPSHQLVQRRDYLQFRGTLTGPHLTVRRDEAMEQETRFRTGATPQLEESSVGCRSRF